MIKVIKKDGTLEDYNFDKIINAVNKSAERVRHTFTEEELNKLKEEVEKSLTKDKIDILEMHNIVEDALSKVNSRVAKSYRDYRNYKTSFVNVLDTVYKKRKDLEYLSDVDNANRDSALVSTQRSIVYDTLNTELYHEFFLNVEERQAAKDGYIYIHDKSARLDTLNCCLFDMANVLKDGFEMGNVWYNEPNSLDTAFDVISDVTISAAAQQYGGFTIPEVDKILAPYAEKSYHKYYSEYLKALVDTCDYLGHKVLTDMQERELENKAHDYAMKKVRREFEQGFQGWEYKFNTVGSSRGDYPFIAISFGIGTEPFEVMASEMALEVRKNGQGKKGFKKPVLFPKLTFLYDEELHGEGKQFEWLFDKAIECSSKAMYPDYLSLTGEGYIPSMYKKYKRVVSLMGCVRGKETISYKLNGKEFKNKPIESLYKKLKKISKEYYQSYKLSTYFKTNDLDLSIYDTKANKYVKVKSFIRNENQNNWVKLTLNNGLTLTATNNHPLQTNKGRLEIKQFTIDTLVKTVKDGLIGIKKLENIDLNEFSYDVETETDCFDVSGICSHNCRASLSPWYERGGMNPADEDDKPVFVGRFNLGAISLNLPMIAMKAKKENKDFYEVLDYYLELIRGLHKKTFEFLSHKKASTNPLGYMQGGFLNGHKEANEELGKDYLRPMTMSFGITALNELEQVWHQKSIVEDGSFALEVMQHINDKIAQFKKEDNILYAIYGTPAETLAGLQVKQFRDMYGVVDNVSSRSYVSNSFHCGVWEDISGFEKQDYENRFWNLFNGGKIQYVRYPVMYNTKAMKDTVKRAMKLGFYEGVNLSLAYCEECGYQELEMDQCPKCGSRLITKIERMNGYLLYSRVHGHTRTNAAKMDEIKDRKSM